MRSESNLPEKTLKILYIASEAEPLVKVGGLGDVAGSLPYALRNLFPEQTFGYRLDVRLALPYHAAIRQRIEKPRHLLSFQISNRYGVIDTQVDITTINSLPIYLISGSPIPSEGPVYSGDSRIDGEKYVFFSLASLEMVRQLEWKPDIIQANDWHSATALHVIKLLNKIDNFFCNTISILIIHNLPYMCGDCKDALETFNIPPSEDNNLPEWARHIPLPMGMAAANQIITVSPTYAQEIQTPDFGCGLETFLQNRKDSVSGILNGIDINDWDASNDLVLPSTFSSENLSPRSINKKKLQEEFLLPVQQDIPLLILITRMDHQKGVDIAIHGLRQMADFPWQAIILGTGNPELENLCRQLEYDFPNRVKAAIRFDAKLARQMYGGADILLMPSRYEPCGLAQMIAMRYGCVPVARTTGGLRDTIADCFDDLSQNTGFLFSAPNPEEMVSALKRAIFTYSNNDLWKKIQLNGMRQDFSWHKSAFTYAQTYFQLLEKNT